MKAREHFDKKEYAEALKEWEEEFKKDLIFDTGYTGIGNFIIEAATEVCKKSQLESIDELKNFPPYYLALLKASLHYLQKNYDTATQQYSIAHDLLQAEEKKEPKSEYWVTKINFYYLIALTWEYRAHIACRQNLMEKTKEFFTLARGIAINTTPSYHAIMHYHSANAYINLAANLKNQNKLQEMNALAAEAKVFAETGEKLSANATSKTNFDNAYNELMKSIKEEQAMLERIDALEKKDQEKATQLALLEKQDKENMAQIEELKNKNALLEKQNLDNIMQIEQLKKANQELFEKMTEHHFHNNMLLNGAKEGNLDKIDHALKVGGANIQSINENGQTALHLAINHNHLSIAESLLKVEPKLFITPDKEGLTPLQLIAKTKQLNMADWLYEKGKTIPKEEFDKIYEVASEEIKSYLVNKKLFESAKTGDIAGITDAINKKAIINAKATNGETALHKAVYHQYKDIVQLLIDCGADPTIRNNKENEIIEQKIHDTALKYAIDLKNAELITIVATPFLIFAAQHGNMDDVVSAIKAGAKLNGADSNGQTALHKAILAGHVEIIDLLLRQHAENKIDIHIEDKNGKSPYMLAKDSAIKVKVKADKEIALEIYLLEKFGAYKFEIKSMKKSTIANSPHSFAASMNKSGEGDLPVIVNTSTNMNPKY